MNKIKFSEVGLVKIISPVIDYEAKLSFFSGGISAGFPSPALDFADLSIDLNKHIIKHPSATFYGRVQGYSMQDEGIQDGDLLVIDKSLEASNGKIVVCFIDGEFTVKKLRLEGDSCWLMPANKAYSPILVTSDNDFLIWGVVTFVIKSF